MRGLCYQECTLRKLGRRVPGRCHYTQPVDITGQDGGRERERGTSLKKSVTQDVSYVQRIDLLGANYRQIGARHVGPGNVGGARADGASLTISAGKGG